MSAWVAELLLTSSIPEAVEDSSIDVGYWSGQNPLSSGSSVDLEDLSLKNGTLFLYSSGP
jgi:hypothetical protein